MDQAPSSNSETSTVSTKQEPADSASVLRHPAPLQSAIMV
jgi:hypothetical protein